jgi:hypothetical protein
MVSSLVVRLCLLLAGSGASALTPPCQMMRFWQVRPLSLSPPGFWGVMTISVMTARMNR